MLATFDIDSCLGAFRLGDTDKLALFLGPDFEFTGATPEPQAATGFLGAVDLLFSAFPDLDWQAEVGHATDEGFRVTTRTTGTHTQTLDLTAKGIGAFEPTGKRFTLPAQEFHWSLRDGMVSSIRATPTEGVGMPAILAQLQLV